MKNIDIDRPRCVVCGRRVNEKKIFFDLKDPIQLNLETVCMCEKCVFRLPSELGTKVIRASQASSLPPEFAILIVDALKNTKGSRIDLNDNYCILLDSDVKENRKFIKSTSYRQCLRNHDKRINSVHSVYLNGIKTVI